MEQKMTNLWYGTPEFTNEKPDTLLRHIIERDATQSSNLNKANTKALSVVDKALALYVQALQKIYQVREAWERTPQLKAAVSMINSAFNFHMLARHAVLHGYVPEIEPLNRAAFERMSRCVAFSRESKLAIRFLEDKQTKQSEVRDALKRMYDENLKGTGDIAEQVLKNIYEQLSEISHPSHQSLHFRAAASGRDFMFIGVDHTYGGERRESVVRIGISHVLSYVLYSLVFMTMVSHDLLGSWNQVFKSKVDAMFKVDDKLMAENMRMMNDGNF